MNLSRPLEDLLGVARGRIIRRLSMVSVGLSGRQLASLAEVPVASASRALADLAETGLVGTQDVGRSRLYQLNRLHVLWKPLEALLAAPATIEQHIAAIARETDENATVAVFGSFARGQASGTSDIDIVIVNVAGAAEDERFALVDAFYKRIRVMTGNRVDMVNIDDDDLVRLVAAEDPLVHSWLEDARTLSGPDLVDRIRRARA